MEPLAPRLALPQHRDALLEGGVLGHRLGRQVLELRQVALDRRAQRRGQVRAQALHLADVLGQARGAPVRGLEHLLALELGLATKVVPADELATEVGALAARLAAGPTVALGAIRQSVVYAAGHSLEESLELESAMMTKTGATADHQAAVAAFVAKEKPAFQGR